jgi:hypothetical protein
MRFLLLLASMLGYTTSAVSQAAGDVGKISLSVVMPENVDGLDNSQLSKLETKIIQLVTQAGLAATGYETNFVIYPKFAIYETNTVEGGMQNIVVLNAELSLFIKQVDNNILFASMSRQLKGSGNNKSAAITQSISKISINDTEVKTFLETGKSKIIAYYAGKCPDILQKSENLVKMKKYDEAIALLLTVPEEIAGCYNQVQVKAMEAFRAHQTQICSEHIQRAKSVMAGHQYDAALDELSEVDPSSSCFQEARQLASNIDSRLTAKEKEQWEFKMKQYNDQQAMAREKLSTEAAIEQNRIQAAREIAVAYYKNQPKRVNYYYLIK